MEKRSRGPMIAIIVLATTGVLVCGLSIWRDWSPAAWWIGAAVLATALIMIAWRRGKHRLRWVACAVVVGLVVAAVPLVEPLTRMRADVAWSLEGSEQPVGGTDASVLTTDVNGVLRMRRADDGTVVWKHEVPSFEMGQDPPVHLVDDVLLIGASTMAGSDDRMVAIDVVTGEELWTASARTVPLVHDGSILLAHDEDRGDAYRGIDVRTGEVLWTSSGSRGDTSAPARTPGSDVPSAAWMVDDPVWDPDTERFDYTVTEVRSGEETVIAGNSGNAYFAFGIVDDRLIVQDMRTHPDEMGSDDATPTTVTAYNLDSGGDVAWEEDLAVEHAAWEQFDLSDRLNTVAGSQLVESAEGEILQVLDLGNGSLVEVPAPSGASFVANRPGPLSRTHAVWADEQTVLATVEDSRLAVVDLDAGSASLLEDTPDSRAPEGTVLRGERSVPVWETRSSTLLGREHDTLTALDPGRPEPPETADLGALPDGTVAGTYSGRVVVVESEEMENTADGEPRTRVTAMHVLEPFDDAP